MKVDVYKSDIYLPTHVLYFIYYETVKVFLTSEYLSKSISL